MLQRAIEGDMTTLAVDAIVNAANYGKDFACLCSPIIASEEDHILLFFAAGFGDLSPGAERDD